MNDNELFSFKNNFESAFSYQAVEYITKESYFNGSNLTYVSYIVEFESYVDVRTRTIITKATRVYGELFDEFSYSPGFFDSYRYYPAQQFDYYCNHLVLEKNIFDLDLNHWIDDYKEDLESAINAFVLDLELENKKGEFVTNRLKIKSNKYIS